MTSTDNSERELLYDVNNRSSSVDKSYMPRAHATHHTILCYPSVRPVGICDRLINGLCDYPLTRCLSNVLGIQVNAHKVTHHKFQAATLVTGFEYKTPKLFSVALDPGLRPRRRTLPALS